jgi:hypothetical protein
MTPNDYYNMAVASELWQEKPISDNTLMAIHLMRFVEMVVAAEREACAKVCVNLDLYDPRITAYDCAAAIRARGEKP